MALKLWSRVVVVVCILLITYNVLAAAGKNSNLSHEKQREFDNHLNRLNKPPVKSIESPDGDIIDCVNIAHQPAFDHPSMKNHKIQMKPTYDPQGDFVTNEEKAKGKSEPITQLWHLKGRCPEGTIPIRRTKMDDILRAGSIENFGKKTHGSIPQSGLTKSVNEVDNNGHEYSVATVKGEKYYGARGSINVWNPKVQDPSEFSLSQIWLVGSSTTNVTTIEVGWQVCPGLYLDSNTRLFIYWTKDSYTNTGCYNLFCEGFVQLNKDIAIGATLAPVSQIGGTPYEIKIFIWKDPVEGNWWLRVGEFTNTVGYWPGELVPDLADGAATVQWGGEIVNFEPNFQHTTTQMGSGRFAEEGPAKASYIRNMQIIDDSNIPRLPKDLKISTSKAGCYDIKSFEIANKEKYIFYGGPGRNPKCP
ncbi:uncharacterized protein LOC116142415 [Pistacia vera]|uniref:uncharacterized protein LOC116142415 n=1 Tax=Pistacia vera TaxID=55513 RepID=UPI001263B5E1|nr:uncharacterized protein LOC116142415 [Pistacia vera]